MERGKWKPKRPALRIRHKIIFSIYLVLFPVLIVTGSFLYYVNYTSVMNETTHRYQTAVESVDENLDYLEQDLLDISTYFIINSDIQRLLGSDPEVVSADPLFWKRLAPMEVIRNMLAVKSHIRTLILYPENGLAPFYISNDTHTVHNQDFDQVRELDIYREAVQALGDNVWKRVDAGEYGLFIQNRESKLVVCREMFDPSKHRRLGFFAISIDESRYVRACSSALLQDNEGMVILDSRNADMIVKAGQVDDEVLQFLSSGRFEPQPYREGKPFAYEGWYIFSTPRGVPDNWIHYITPKSNWNAWILSGLTTPVLLALALLVCIWPLSALASRMISRPLMRLYRSMDRFKDGDFSQQVDVVGQDEIAELSSIFNVMVNDLRELIDRNYVMVLRERQSELNALQAQINPHFLYNTLDALYWQAVDSDQEKLAEDVLALSELFRLLLSSGQGEIPVEQEVRIISNYLHIQKMRFSKKLDYTIQIQDGMGSYRISKLILQPFVENAIVHGLEKKDSWGFVRVTGERRDRELCFTIEDNGTGMERETVDEILFASEDKRYANQRVGHYAIRNVKERMQLSYGDRARLEIDSELGKGTTVRIIVPAEK